jgi:IPT/TIG domain
MRDRLLILVLTAASALALCPVAVAATTIGSPLSVAPEHSTSGSGTFTNTSLAGSLTAPFTGAIVRWRLDVADPGGANLYKLRILRPAGGSNYTAVGTGPAQTAPVAGINVLTLPTPLPVQAGDLIAIDCPNGAPSPSTSHGLVGSTYAFFTPVLGEGKTASPNNHLAGDEVLINADVVGLPSVASISPASGPTSGGTIVSLTGSHLGEVSAVTFGSDPATFTLVSESQLFAVAPPGAGAAAAEVSVVNPAGIAAAPQTFAYQGAPAQGPPAPALAEPGAGVGTSAGAGAGTSTGGGLEKSQSCRPPRKTWRRPTAGSARSPRGKAPPRRPARLSGRCRRRGRCRRPDRRSP